MEELRIYEEIIRLKQARQAAALATIVESSDPARHRVGAKILIWGQGSTLGSIGGGAVETDVIRLATEVLRDEAPRAVSLALNRQQGAACGGRILAFIEPATLPPHLVVIGDGQVGRAVARAAGAAGFAVTTTSGLNEGPGFESDGNASRPLEERPATRGNLRVDRRTYLLIAGSDQQQDFQAALEALATEAGYIGMVGSRAKRMALEKYLARRGVASEQFLRLTCPVGLDIGALTPEEMAVGILAQMIQHRRNHGAPPRSQAVAVQGKPKPAPPGG